MRFHGFQGSEHGGLWRRCGELWQRGPAPIETFARSWLAGWLAGWVGWLAGWAGWLLAGLAGKDERTSDTLEFRGARRMTGSALLRWTF